MLGCIQPMSSPMMKRILGFACCCCCCGGCCCADAGTLAVTTAHGANTPSQQFLVMIIFASSVMAARDGPAAGARFTIAPAFQRDDVEQPALRLEARINHAGLVHVRPLHILRLAPVPRELPMCLCNAPTYRGIACFALLRGLRGRLWAREHHGNERP